jgi:hypothetical protein
MRKLSAFIAAAALGGLAIAATPASASPLASGVVTGNTALPVLDESLVQKVHGWHCRKRFGWYRGDKYWHRHRRACRNYDYHPGYGIGVPFFSFSFYDDDDDHRRRRSKHRRGGDKKDY